MHAERLASVAGLALLKRWWHAGKITLATTLSGSRPHRYMAVHVHCCKGVSAYECLQLLLSQSLPTGGYVAVPVDGDGSASHALALCVDESGTATLFDGGHVVVPVAAWIGVVLARIVEVIRNS